MLIYSYTFNSKANMLKVGKAVYSAVCEKNRYGKDDWRILEGILVDRRMCCACEICCIRHHDACICLNSFIRPFVYFYILCMIIILFLHYLLLRNLFCIYLSLPFKFIVYNSV